MDLTNPSPDLINIDDPLTSALQKLMQGPLAPPRKAFPSSIYTESIYSLDVTSRPSPPLQHEDLSDLPVEPLTLKISDLGTTKEVSSSERGALTNLFTPRSVSVSEFLDEEEISGSYVLYTSFQMLE